MTKTIGPAVSTVVIIAAGATFRHRQRGTSYKVLGKAVLQTKQPLNDDEELVVYVGPDGQLWARPIGEFFDGRFEKVE